MFRRLSPQISKLYHLGRKGRKKTSVTLQRVSKMPGVPAFTTAEAAHTYSPIDTLILRTNEHLSMLNTIFVSKRSRRAVYATTTRGPHTSLWRVAACGTMTEIARVDWEYEVRVASAGDGSLRNSNQPMKRCSMLTFGGRMVRTENFLPKARGWFSSEWVLSPPLIPALTFIGKAAPEPSAPTAPSTSGNREQRTLGWVMANIRVTGTCPTTKQ